MPAPAAVVPYVAMPAPPLLLLYAFFGWFSILPQALFYAADITGWTGLRDALLYTTAWFLVPALFTGRTRHTVIALLGAVMAFCALAKLGNFILFHQEISQSVFVAVFETNPSEATEFFQHYFQWWMIPLATVYVLPAIWLAWQLRQWHPAPKTRAILFVVATLFIMQPLFSKGFDAKGWKRLKQRFETIEPWSMVQNYVQYRDHLAEAENLLTNMEEVSRHAIVTSRDPAPQQTYVLVIGESTARARLGLYGYSRPTSPALSAIRQELLVYNDVVSAIPYTIESLSTALTFTDPEHVEHAFRSINLITLMKQAGFKTTWITNQQTLSQRNTLLTAFAKLADSAIFLNHNRRQSSSSYDEVVLAPFMEALQDPAPRKLIIVHLIGAHFSYQYRYPPAFAVFDGQAPPTSIPLNEEEKAIYNTYDNAVLYNDHVVNELISRFRAQDPYGALLYFADHGEEVFDVRKLNGRNMSEPTPNMYEVPFLLWPSPRWAAARDMQALRATVNRPASLSTFLHIWCDLTAMDYSECKPAYSVFSPDFQAQPRWVGVSSNRFSYEALKAAFLASAPLPEPEPADRAASQR